jgi:hypothetical protein
MIKLNRRAGWLAAAALALTMFSVSAPAFAQEISPDQMALARKYVDLTDKVDIYAASVTDVAQQTVGTILKLNPSIQQQVTAAVTVVINDYKGHRADLMDSIAIIYAQTFTADELQQYVTFYSTPAGQKLLSKNFDINQLLQGAIQTFHANLANEFYAKVKAELKSKGVAF